MREGKFRVTSHFIDARFSYRGVPAPASVSDCYESMSPGLRSGIDRSGSFSFAIRDIPSSIRPLIRHWYENAPTPLRLCLGIPSIFRIVIPAKAGIQKGWVEGKCMRSKTTRGEGLVPRWGGGGAWQNPPCQFAPPSHNSSFSYRGVPAPAGMSDCYENALEPLSTAPLNPNIPRSRHSGAPRFVIPAKAGIHARTFRERTPTAIPPPTSTRQPHLVFPAIARPVPRYATAIQRRCMGGK